MEQKILLGFVSKTNNLFQKSQIRSGVLEKCAELLQAFFKKKKKVNAEKTPIIILFFCKFVLEDKNIQS